MRHNTLQAKLGIVPLLELPLKPKVYEFPVAAHLKETPCVDICLA